MDPIGPAIASSVAGARAAEDRQAKQARREEGPAREVRRRADDVDVHVEETEESDAPRNAKSNDQEESREDRQALGYYDHHGALSDSERRQLDVNG